MPGCRRDGHITERIDQLRSPELLTVAEAAELLRTTPGAVYDMADRGKLPGLVRIGRRVLVRTADLRAHLGLKERCT